MDNQNRPTIELKTTHGHVVVLKEYATGRESNQLQDLYLNSAKITIVGSQPKIDGFDPKIEQEVIAKMIDLFVVSVDGEKNSLIDTVLDLRVEDYNDVVEKLNEITGKKKTADTSKQ